MPLFRFHRSELSESLKTTVIVKSNFELFIVIMLSELVSNQDWSFKLEINPYPDKENNFDSRIGWYTQIVLSNIFKKDKMAPIGFLSEPLLD